MGSVSLPMTEETNIEDRSRFLIQYQDDYLAINDRYELEAGSALDTCDDLLSETFYAAPQDNESRHRLDSEKHSVYSLDFDSETGVLIWSNMWGYDRDPSSGYLCFRYDSSSQVLTASKRYLFRSEEGSFFEDTGFSSMTVYYEDTWKLGSTTSQLTLYDSGFDFALPSYFNPDNMAPVENGRVVWTTASVTTYADHIWSGDRLYKDAHLNYQGQIQFAGADASATSAAAAMLSRI